MDEVVRQHASDLFEQFQNTAIGARSEKIKSLKQEMAKGGFTGGFSGFEYGRHIAVDVEFIENVMAARLRAYREAFENSGATPSAADFDEIWYQVQQTQRSAIQQAAVYLSEYQRLRAFDAGDPKERLLADTGRGHDQVLLEFKAWRSGTAARSANALKAKSKQDVVLRQMAMARNATALRILIASPSDVDTEREIIATVIGEWNAAHSRSTGIILEPIRWNTHAYPDTGTNLTLYMKFAGIYEKEIRVIGKNRETLTTEIRTRTVTTAYPSPPSSFSLSGCAYCSVGLGCSLQIPPISPRSCIMNDVGQPSWSGSTSS